MMQVKQRIDLIRLSQKLESNHSYSKKLGIKVDFRIGKDEEPKTIKPADKK